MLYSGKKNMVKLVLRITSLIVANLEEIMTIAKVEEIQVAIESLPQQEYKRLRQWFSDRDWEKWDKQIEEDLESGKLDFLINEALNEKAEGVLREL